MKVKKFLTALSAASVLASVTNLPVYAKPITSPPIREELENVTEVDGGGLFRDYEKGGTVYTNADMNHFMITVPANNRIYIYPVDTDDPDKYMEQIEAIIKKFEDIYSFAYEIYPKYRIVIYSRNEKNFNEFSDKLQEELAETDLVSYYYPPGSVDDHVSFSPMGHGMNCYSYTIENQDALSEYAENDPGHHLEKISSGSGRCFHIVNDNEAEDTPEDRFETAKKVYKETGIAVPLVSPAMIFRDIAGKGVYLGKEPQTPYIKPEPEPAEPPISNTNTITVPADDTVYDDFLYGDVDKNGEVGLSDLISLSKTLTSPSLFPLDKSESSKALKQADVVRDNVLDSLDVSRLTEYILGNISSDELAVS